MDDLPVTWRTLSHSWCQASSCVSMVLMTSRKSHSTCRPDEFVVPEYSKSRLRVKIRCRSCVAR